jgi:predicted nuclease of predicted toxin-antitoxin system
VRLLADEGVEAAIVARLRADGHDVLYVAELAPGVTDETMLELAAREGRLLLTADKDFGELVFRLRRASHGVLLLRLVGLSQERKAEAASEALREHGAEMAAAFTVITPGLVRIRPPV